MNVYLLIALFNVPLASLYGPESYAVVTAAMMITWFVLKVH